MSKKLLLLLFLSYFFNMGYATVKDTAVCAAQDFAMYAGISSGEMYQWQIKKVGTTDFVDLENNIIYQNTGEDTLTIRKMPSYLSGAQFRCAVFVNNIATYGDTFLISIKATWLGTIDSNWKDARNWDCGIIPDRYTTVYVPSVTHSGGHDFHVYTGMEVNKIKVLPDAKVKVDTPGYVIIWGDTTWPTDTNSIDTLQERIWWGYSGEIGDVNIGTVNSYLAGTTCSGDVQVYEYLYVDTLLMIFNPDSTGMIRFYNHEWFYGSCTEDPYDIYYTAEKNFIWQGTPDPQKVIITFEGGLASDEEGPLLFNIIETPEPLLHLSAVLQPLPDDLYFNVIFR